MLTEMEKVQPVTWIGNSMAVTPRIEKKKNFFSVLKVTCMLAVINIHCRDDKKKDQINVLKFRASSAIFVYDNRNTRISECLQMHRHHYARRL